MRFFPVFDEDRLKLSIYESELDDFDRSPSTSNSGKEIDKRINNIEQDTENVGFNDNFL